MYKDKDKQKEANRAAQARFKASKKVLPNEGITGGVLPANFGQPDCECRHCRANRANGNRHVLNHGTAKPYPLLDRNELNRVSLPGDTDYTGVALSYSGEPSVE